MENRFRCRLATADDASGIASVFSPSFRLLTFLPMLHTAEQDRWFIENVILKECEVVLAECDAERDGRIVSFLARDGEEIRMLYTHPDVVGSGAGGLLLEAAKASGVRYRWQPTPRRCP